jgi:hypothetical protein
MKLISFNRREDFGIEIYAQILHTKRWALLQVSFSFNDYPGWPYLQINSGSNGLLSVFFWVWKLGMDVDVLSRTWRRDYREDEEQ